jgi:ribosomal protein S3
VTATFHGALALTAFLRMKVRPVRIDGRIRFRAMSAEKGVTPGTVELDPRSDETQQAVERASPAPGSLKAEAEIITPDVVEPVSVVETDRKPDATPEPEKKNDVQE